MRSTRRDWYWWRFHFIYRETIERGFGVMYFPGAPLTHTYATYTPTVDVWLGARFWTVLWLRHYE